MSSTAKVFYWVILIIYVVLYFYTLKINGNLPYEPTPLKYSIIFFAEKIFCLAVFCMFFVTTFGVLRKINFVPFSIAVMRVVNEVLDFCEIVHINNQKALLIEFFIVLTVLITVGLWVLVLKR